LAAQKEQQVSGNNLDKFRMISTHHWQWFHSTSSSPSSSPHSPQNYGQNNAGMISNGSPPVPLPNSGDVRDMTASAHEGNCTRIFSLYSRSRL
jgi:hypothetical protein